MVTQSVKFNGYNGTIGLNETITSVKIDIQNFQFRENRRHVQVCGLKKFRCHADHDTVSRCRIRIES